MDASRFDHLTRYLGGRTTRRTALGTALAGLGLGGLDRIAAAQDATPAPAPNTPPAPVGEESVFMFVQTAASGRGEVNPGAGSPVASGTPAPGALPPAPEAPFLLTLDGHTGLTVYFSDRPERIVGATPTQDFLDTLGFAADNPPNAALVAEFRAGQGVVVLKLTQPSYDADTGTLMYGAEVLDAYQGGNLEPVTREQLVERLPAEFGPAALFIDSCPRYDTCQKLSYDESNYEWNSFTLGPIPGGPYKMCWQLSSDLTQSGQCVPCDGGDWTVYDLRVKCSIEYGCAVPRDGYTYCHVS